MNRDQLSELLSAYVDGEVDDRERALVERVLREDAWARRLLEELRRTVNAVASLPRHAAPPTLAADLEAQLERAELLGGAETHPVPLQERRAPWTAWLAMAAMLGVVVVAGWWFLVDRGQQGVGRAKNKVATADARRERVGADGSALPSAALGPAGRDALASHAAGQTVESQLAAGADPAALTRQSFAPETVRLQVVAVNAAERDALAERLVKRMSEQQTENLAKRSGASGSKQPVDSFFLVGKAGINFDDPRQQQVLVRVPRSQAAHVVDDLTAVAGSEDRIALQAGPIAVRGAISARNLLQMVGQAPSEADSVAKEPKSSEAESKIAFAGKQAEPAGGPVESAKKPADSNRFDPLSGLMKIAGLDTDALSRRSGRIGDRIGKTGSAEDSPQPISPEKKYLAESTPDTATEESRSLVQRRQAAAENAPAKNLSRNLNEGATGGLPASARADKLPVAPDSEISSKAKTAEDTSDVKKEAVVAFQESESAGLGAGGANGAAAGETVAAVKQDDYVTIVIEFVVPATQSKPPPAPKPKPVPASKSSK